MLTELSIKNFALIDDLTLEFGQGLNILTGETGAGKSILIGALGVILGEKRSPDWLRQGADEGEVEALFQLPENQNITPFLAESGLSVEDELIIRRTFSSDGKSKCYVNGRAFPLSFLKDLGDLMVDIHGQHEHQSLLKSDNQLSLLDSFAGTESLESSLISDISLLRKKEGELAKIKEREAERGERIDYLTFQINEIASSGIDEVDEEALIAEKKLMQHAEQRSGVGLEAYDLLYGGEGSAVEKFNDSFKLLDKITHIDPRIGEISKGMREGLYAIEEGASALRDYIDSIEVDPDKLAEIDERLAEVNRLKRKYGGSIEAVMAKMASMQEELDGFEEMGERGELLDGEIEELRKVVSTGCVKLADRREEAGGRLGQEVSEGLKGLRMDNALFEVRFDYGEDGGSFVSYRGKNVPLTAKGIGKIEFYFSSNLGVDAKPLAKIASGGELSRVMLILKNIIAGKDSVPILIFDEIDTGMGGKAADLVGRKIKEVSARHQLFCVTHLPQIASMADNHFFIEKIAQEGRTVVLAKRLTDKERVDEIARMSGGVLVTETTRRHAEEMIESRKRLD
ncbi:MAG: DNA repair protein RecN [Nitrospinota bacterium]|nr:DNA repair protein RecN [Nitrospinota bacterium]